MDFESQLSDTKQFFQRRVLLFLGLYSSIHMRVYEGDAE